MVKKTTVWDKVKEIVIVLGSIAAILGVVIAYPMYSETKRSNDINADQNKTVLSAELQNKYNRVLIVSSEVQLAVRVKNTGQEPLLSNEKELQGYDAYSFLNIKCLNSSGDILSSSDFSFESKIGATEMKDISLPLLSTVPPNTSIIQIGFSCIPKNMEVKPCVPRSNVLTLYYLKKLEILGVDATKSNDKINLGIARKPITEVSQSESVYKTVPAGIEFPLTHKDQRENWGGIILLYNSHFSVDSDVVRTIKELLQNTYGYAPIILKEYNLENFNFYTQRFFECKPEGGKNICVSKAMKFTDMKSGADQEGNLFSKTIFSENPDLDFMFFLPYNNQK